MPLEQPVPGADKSDGSPLSPMEKDVRNCELFPILFILL